MTESYHDDAKASSPLLIEEPPLQVLPSLAVAVGLNEAILLQQIHYWVKHKRADPDRYPDSFREERCWVYNSVEEWRAQFPFWSGDTIQRALKSLKNKGVLIVEQFRKADWDRRNWYAIDYEALKALQITPPGVRQSITAKCGSREGQDAAVDDRKTPPIDHRKMRRSLSESPSEKTQRIPQRLAPAGAQEVLPPALEEQKEPAVNAAKRLLAEANTPFAQARRMKKGGGT